MSYGWELAILLNGSGRCVCPAVADDHADVRWRLDGYVGGRARVAREGFEKILDLGDGAGPAVLG